METGRRLDLTVEEDRYSRLRLIPWWDQELLRRSHVLVVGAGALGNEILKNLALVGVGRVTIVDMDRVEPSNLSRSVLFRLEDRGRPKAEVAAERVRQLNPDVCAGWIHASVTEVGTGLFRAVDVVIAGLDNREARLAINQRCWRVGVPWVDGAIEVLSGVARVFVPPNGACYECTLDSRDYALMAQRRTCALLSREEILSGKVPTTPTTASVIAGIQVQEALKLLHRRRELPVLDSRGFVFNGLTHDSYVVRYDRRAGCLSHDTYEEVWEIPLGAQDATAADLIRAAQQVLADCHAQEADASAPSSRAGWCVELPDEVCTGMRCVTCGVTRDVVSPLRRLSHGDVACPRCGQVMHLELTHAVEEGSPLEGRPLSELGVPAWDIVTVRGPEGLRVPLELAGDRDTVLRCGRC